MVLWHCCTFASSSDESAKAKPKNNGTKSVEGSNALATNGAQKSDANSTAAVADKGGENDASKTTTAGLPKTSAGGETLPPFNVLSSFQNNQSPTSVATPPPSAANVVDLTEGDDVLAELGQIGAGRSSRKSSRPSTPVKKMLSSGEQKCKNLVRLFVVKSFAPNATHSS